MTSQIVTVTVHHPRVESVHRLTNDPNDQLLVTLGNGEYHGHVTLLVSDADWNSIGMAVSAFLDGENDRGTRPGDYVYDTSTAIADYSYEGGSGEWLQGADLRNADLKTGHIPPIPWPPEADYDD